MTITKSSRMALTVESDNELVDPFPDNWPILDNYAGALIVPNGTTPDPATLFDGSVIAEQTSGIMWMADFSGGVLAKRYLMYPFIANASKASVSVPNGPNANQPFALDDPAPNTFTNAVCINWDEDLATTAGRIKAPVDGIYAITGEFTGSHSTAGSRGLYLMINGAEIVQVIDLALGAGATAFQASIIRKLVAGDLVGISFWQNSGTAGNFGFNLCVTMVSPL